MFDLFTGRPPFLGEHALAVIQQTSEKPAPKLRSLAPALDRDLETICAGCLEREPQARYLSASDLAVDLERWLEQLLNHYASRFAAGAGLALVKAQPEVCCCDNRGVLLCHGTRVPAVFS